MKNYKTLFSLLLLLVCLVGCTDYLDIKPKGKDIPESLKHFDGLLNSTNMINAEFNEILSNGGTHAKQSDQFFQFMTDEIIIDEKSIFMTLTDERSYRWDEKIFSVEEDCAEWGNPYTQNYTFNVIINNVMDAVDGTTEQKKALFAEASVRRAYNYLQLVQIFGKPYNKATASEDLCVPLVLEADASMKNFKRESVQTIYDFILSEMEENCKYLSDKTALNLRMSKASGYTFLGKAYFAKGDYENALRSLKIAYDAAKASSPTVALFDYNTMLPEWGYIPSMPWMFGMMSSYPICNRTSYSESTYTIMLMLSRLMFYFPAVTYVKDEYMDKYEADDLRRCFFSNRDYSGSVEYSHYKRIQGVTVNIGASLPDLYLMLAECEARVGSMEAAKSLLVEFRSHRMPATSAEVPASVKSKDDLVKFVVDERLREFMQTGLRWFDMRRLWNDPLFQYLKTGYTHSDGKGGVYTLTEDRLVYEIPEKIMNMNPNWGKTK